MAGKELSCILGRKEVCSAAFWEGRRYAQVYSKKASRHTQVCFRKAGKGCQVHSGKEAQSATILVAWPVLKGEGYGTRTNIGCLTLNRIVAWGASLPLCIIRTGFISVLLLPKCLAMCLIINTGRKKERRNHKTRASKTVSCEMLSSHLCLYITEVSRPRRNKMELESHLFVLHHSNSSPLIPDRLSHACTWKGERSSCYWFQQSANRWMEMDEAWKDRSKTSNKRLLANTRRLLNQKDSANNSLQNSRKAKTEGSLPLHCSTWFSLSPSVASLNWDIHNSFWKIKTCVFMWLLQCRLTSVYVSMVCLSHDTARIV